MMTLHPTLSQKTRHNVTLSAIFIRIMPFLAFFIILGFLSLAPAGAQAADYSVGFNTINAINVGNYFNVTWNAPYSWDFWIYPHTGITDNMGIIGKSTTAAVGWMFKTYLTDKLLFLLGASGGYRIVEYTNNSLAALAWQHIVLTYDGSHSAAGTKIYINGQLQDTTVLTDTLNATVSNTKDYVIGWAAETSVYNGHIDELRGWSRELSQTDVDDLYNSGNGKYTPANTNNLIYDFHFDEGTGTTTTDSIGSVVGNLGYAVSWEAGKVQAVVCDAEHCSLCLSQGTCEAACGVGHWYEEACHQELPPCDAEHCANCVTYAECLSACGASHWWEGSCHQTVRGLTYYLISIINPTENAEINADSVEIRGICKYPNIEIEIEKDGTPAGSAYAGCGQYPPHYDDRYRLIQEIIVDGYTTSTGRTAGYTRFTKELTDFADIVQDDYSDIRFYRYDGDFELMEAEIEEWWWVDNYFFFPVKIEQVTGYPQPKYRYFIEYSWEYENRPPTLQTSDPPEYQFTGTVWPEIRSIEGIYATTLGYLENGDYTIRAREFVIYPSYLYSPWTSARHFVVRWGERPVCAWQDTTILYPSWSPYDTPSPFLSKFLENIRGLFAPIMNFVCNFNRFFSASAAQTYAATMVAHFKTFISFTKLFDNIIGGYPITGGLILLILVYTMIIVIGKITNVSKLFKL